MITLESTLTNKVEGLAKLKETLQSYQFTIGGNWDYHHAYFDRALDEAQKVWLRIPVQAEGSSVIEADYEDEDSSVKILQPFILKHVYNEGLDQNADMQTMGGFVNQFQQPIDSDGKVEQHWVEQATEILRQIEQAVESASIS